MSEVTAKYRIVKTGVVMEAVVEVRSTKGWAEYRVATAPIANYAALANACMQEAQNAVEQHEDAAAIITLTQTGV